MSDTGRLSGRSSDVNSPSHFSYARKKLEDLLSQDAIPTIEGALGWSLKHTKRNNGTISFWGVGCPWCGKEGDKEATPTYVSSNKKKIHCASCGQSESIAFLILEAFGASLRSDPQTCAEIIAKSIGINLPDELPRAAVSDDWVIDMSDPPEKKKPAPRDAGSMPKAKQSWIENQIKAFIKRADEGSLTPQEKKAIGFLMRRGISEETIRKAEVFAKSTATKTMVVMPSRDDSGNPIGYQWFDYNEAHTSGKAQYRACGSEHGSCRWPFGVKTCGEEGSILMVCGFSDYLAALEIGIERVISPYGITMLSGDADHLRPVVEGRSVTILFDYKKQEIEAAWSNASSLLGAGAKCVNIMAWCDKADGYDLSDFLMESKEGQVSDLLRDFKACIKIGPMKVFKDVKGTKEELILALEAVGLGPTVEVECIEEEALAPAEQSDPSPAEQSEPGRGKAGPEFHPDLEVSISGLGPLDEFHTLIMFTDFSTRFEMCDELSVRRCRLGDGCTCATQRRLDISDGSYSAAFSNSQKMSGALQAINETYDFLCPRNEGWEKTQKGKAGEPKRILYKVGENSSTWRVIEARSLFSSGSKVVMVTKIPDIKTGIYEVRGFKSSHCGMTGSTFVVSSMLPYSIDAIIDSMGEQECDVGEADFFDRVSALMGSGIVDTPDMILTAATCAWAFSPPVVPLIKDLGRKKANYRQPSLSLYVIGDPATGKTLTVRQCSKAAGNECDPTDAKMATKPGLIISGADGSPGQMTRSICGAMGLDEITDRKSVLEIVQLLVENRAAISMSGRHIDEVVPVRTAMLSNADASRKKIHEFRTPMEAATKLMKEHLIRRIDLCVASTPIVSEVDAEARNESIYSPNHGEEIDSESLLKIGRRSWRQKPSKIVMTDEAGKMLSKEKDIILSFGHVRMGNPMMYGDITQKVFRVACGIAAFCSSFEDDRLVVRSSHITDSVILLSQCMTSMGASKEARIHMRTMNVDRAHKTLVDVCVKCLEFLENNSPNMNLVGRTIISFIQSCNANEPGSVVETGISSAFRSKEIKSDMDTPDTSVDHYKKAWNLVDRMRKSGLIASESRGSYTATETFSRSVAIMEVDNTGLYRDIIGDMDDA